VVETPPDTFEGKMTQVRDGFSVDAVFKLTSQGMDKSLPRGKRRNVQTAGTKSQKWESLASSEMSRQQVQNHKGGKAWPVQKCQQKV
jgi:hypothetical protein